ncbi:MAG TPA: AAA family ATPase [Thermoleophilaceae bacterium]|nr:AAA family ATPase [Thermoleophilaceae bacterium]
MIDADFAIVGREAELAELRSFVSVPDSGAVVLLLAGEAGIGKTALWQAALADAEAAGVAVRSSRPGESEASFSFAVLADLLAAAPDELFFALPLPQRRALEVALLRREAGDVAPPMHVVAAGFLAALRALSAESPVLVAVDDIQWADPASAAALEFALRRIGPGERVRFLLARRSGGGPGLDLASALVPERLARLELGPMSFGAIQHLLGMRLPSRLPRPAVRRIHDVSGGNPFYALELAHALLRHGTRLDLSGDLPVPDTLSALVASHLDAAGPEAAQALLIVTLLADAPEGLVVQAAAGGGGVERALAAGFLVRDGGRLRLAHPLFGSVLAARTSPEDRRLAHLELASLVADREERVRHLALGSLAPDRQVATELDEAADAAAARGATVAAAQLAEAAWRFTPMEDVENRTERLLDCAERHRRAGAVERVTELLEPELDALPDGPVKARALLLLSQREETPIRLGRLDEALEHADAAMRAEILAEKSFSSALGQVDDVPAAREWAAEALSLAETVGDEALTALCLTTLAWTEALLGREVEHLLGRIESSQLHRLASYDHPGRLRSVRAIWRGELDQARASLEALFSREHAQEEEWAITVFAVHQAELEMRAGDWHAASRTCELMREGLLVGAAEPRLRACVAAARGDRQQAEAAAAVALNLRGTYSDRWQRIDATRARGLAALFTGDEEQAVVHLSEVADAVTLGGVRDPGAFPFAPDLVEALAATGRFSEAEVVLEWLERLSAEQEHPWGLASAARARGVLAAARGEDKRAETALHEALELHARLALPFDEARARLALGALMRRAKRRAEARRFLEAAAAAFESLGSPPLAERARDELSRLGGRRTSPGLTPTERRIAELVAQGNTNREVAAKLVVTAGTVEAHLTRIYGKLGIRSRTELAGKMLAGGPDVPAGER